MAKAPAAKVSKANGLLIFVVLRQGFMYPLALKSSLSRHFRAKVYADWFRRPLMLYMCFEGLAFRDPRPLMQVMQGICIMLHRFLGVFQLRIICSLYKPRLLKVYVKI